jgi:hypothetical protein
MFYAGNVAIEYCDYFCSDEAGRGEGESGVFRSCDVNTNCTLLSVDLRPPPVLGVLDGVGGHPSFKKKSENILITVSIS